MARILIPTRNRPTSLASVIGYLDRFHPGTQVIVADGSSDEHAAENARNTAAPGRATEVDYRRYPYEMPFFDRILDVLENESDAFFIMGSDDDYPLMDALNRGEALLADDPDGATALGATLMLKLHGIDDLTAGMSIARSILRPDPLTRARQYSSMSFSTTYAVTRRELLVERYRRARQVFLPGFFDFGVGLHDSFAGRIHALPRFSYIATRNFNHSYLRAKDPLVFMRRTDEFFQLKTFVEEDLRARAGLDAEAAETAATRIVLMRVGELAWPATRRTGDPASQDLLAKAAVQDQLAAFDDLFRDGTVTRKLMFDRLRFAVDAMQDVARSQDNAGEPTTVDSLSKQNKPVTAAEDDEGRTMLKMFRSSDELDEAAAAHRRRAQSGRRLIALPPETRIDKTTLHKRNAAPERILHLLVLGQSNVASHGDGRARSAVGSMVNPAGLMMPLADPVRGGSGQGGSIWPRVADRAVDAGLCDRLVVTVRAVSGASVESWARGGDNFTALKGEINRIAAGSPPVDLVVWHQGERDTKDGTRTRPYVVRFKELHAMVGAALPGVEWLVCRASYRMGVTSKHVLRAQDQIAKLSGIHAGPDTDTVLGPELRFDDTHLSAAGLDRFADEIVAALARLRPPPAVAPAEGEPDTPD